MTPETALLARARAIGAELWAEGDLLRWRCPGGLPEDLKADLTANKPAVLAVLPRQPDVQKNSLPETSRQNDRHDRCNRHTEAHRLWTVVEPHGAVWRSSVSPPMTMAALLGAYPPGTVAAPVEDPDEGQPLPADVVELVMGWLDQIGETDPDIRREIMAKAQADPAAMQTFINRSKPEVPKPEPASRYPAAPGRATNAPSGFRR